MPQLRSSLSQQLAIASLTLHACALDSVGARPDADGASRDAAVNGPTYTRDVRPILTRACVPCHTAGEIAPYPLDTYEAATRLARQMASAIHSGAMPPAPIDNSGACNSYRDTPRLTPAEVSTLDEWIAAGAPQGDPNIPAPPPPVFPTLRGAVRTISTASDYAPSTEQPDAHHCFVAEAPIADGAYFVTGFNVRPGNRRIVHHVIVHYPRNDTAAAEVRALDASDPGPGYPCFVDSRVDATPVAAWAPGYGAARFPEGLGVRLAGGRPLVIEIHYNTLNGGGSDRTDVDLEVRTEAVTAGRFVALITEDLYLPPHMLDVAATTTRSVREVTSSDTPVHLYGVFPHMHTLAKSQHIEVVRHDAASACVADVPRWNFHWQRLYLYENPLLLDPRDELSLTCRYNTTTRNAPVMWGEGTSDEMCLAVLFVGP